MCSSYSVLIGGILLSHRTAVWVGELFILNVPNTEQGHQTSIWCVLYLRQSASKKRTGKVIKEKVIQQAFPCVVINKLYKISNPLGKLCGGRKGGGDCIKKVNSTFCLFRRELVNTGNLRTTLYLD